MADLNSKLSIVIDKNLKKLGRKDFAKTRDRLIAREVISYGVEIGKVRKITKNTLNNFKPIKRSTG